MLLRIFLQVFSQPRYVGVAVVLAWTVLSLVVWVPQLDFIMTVWALDSITWSNRLMVLVALYGSVVTNQTWLGTVYLVVIPVLFGTQVSLLLYYIRRRQVIDRTAVRAKLGTIGGMVAGLFGVGCAACGSLILSSLLASVGGVVVLQWLPLHGAEFGLLGIGLLLYAIWRLLEALSAPNVCPVE